MKNSIKLSIQQTPCVPATLPASPPPERKARPSCQVQPSSRKPPASPASMVDLQSTSANSPTRQSRAAGANSLNGLGDSSFAFPLSQLAERRESLASWLTNHREDGRSRPSHAAENSIH